MSEGSNVSKFSTRYSQARRKRVPKADFKREKKIKKNTITANDAEADLLCKISCIKKVYSAAAHLFIQ
jgi:hypothetical protein